MKLKNVAALLAISLLPSWSIAQQQGDDDSYWGAAWVMAEVGDFDVSAIQGRYGWRWKDNLYFEGLAAFGVGDDTISGVNGELDHVIGAYVLGEWPVTELLDVYGRLGFAYAEASASNMLASESESESDISYGIGATYEMAENVNLDVGYMNYVSGDLDANGIYIGAQFPIQ